MKLRNFSLTVAEGIAHATFDVPNASMNTITAEVQAELSAVAARARDDDQVRGLVIASGKESGFCAGADLGELERSMAAWRAAETQDDLRRGVEDAGRFAAVLRAMETCGKPVVAIVHGVCLGGGLELALAGHHRISTGHMGRLRLGLPEATIGLMPGGGATQRLPRLMGVAAALPFLLDGSTIEPEAAAGANLLHQHVDDAGAAAEAARTWIMGNQASQQPWDQKGYRLIDGPHSPSGYSTLPFLIAMARGDGARTHAARANILRAVYEGSQVGIDAGLRIEARYFFGSARSTEAAAMVRTLFHQRQVVARRRAAVPEGYRERLLGGWRRGAEKLIEDGHEAAVVRGVARALSPGLSAGLGNEPSPRAGHELPDPARVGEIRSTLLAEAARAAVRAMNEGVVQDASEADVFGIDVGFPASTGGPLSFLSREREELPA